MLVEFERVAAPHSEFGEDDGIESTTPRIVALDPTFVAVAFESAEEPNVTVIRMKDGRSGFKVRGSYREVATKLAGRSVVAEGEVLAAEGGQH